MVPADSLPARSISEVNVCRLAGAALPPYNIGMFARLADLLVRRSLPAFGLLLAFTVAAAVLAPRIRFDFAPQSMLRGDARLIRELNDFKQTFAYEDSVLMVVLEATGEGDVLTTEALTWQAAVAREVGELPSIDRIEAVATMNAIRRGLSLPPQLEAVPVIRDLPVDESTAERVRRLSDASPLMEGSLLSEDRRVTALLAFIQPDVQRLEEIRRVNRRVQGVLDQHPAPAGYRVRLTGLPFLRVDTVDNLQADQRRLLPIAAALYLAMLGLTFRRLSGSLVPMVAVGMGLAWTIGGLVLLGATFNLVSNILPILLLVIGVSNCVHIIADYAEQLPRAGGDRSTAVREVIRHMGFACFLSMLTTAVGFASLFTARSDALVEFGWQCALGMGCLYVAIIGVLGSLLKYFRPPRTSENGAPLSGLIARFARIVERHPGWTLAIAGLVVGTMLWFARGVRVNASMIETYEEDHPTLQSLKLVENRLGGLLPIEVHLFADEPGRFLQPDVFHQVSEFEEYARGQESVLFARSYVDFHDAIGAGLTARREEADESAPEETDDQLIRRLQRSDYVISRVGEELSYDSFMTDDGRQARVLLKVRDVGTRRLQRLIEAVRADLNSRFPAGSGVEFTITGDAYVNTVAMSNVVRDLFTSLLTASAVIFSVIGLGFRSLRAGLIAAIPNGTPLLCTLGYMGLRNYDLSVSNVIVFTISLGIAVDDTIHFLSRFREELHRRHDVGEAVRAAYSQTGRAIVIVTILIVSGLAVLLLSDFVPTRRFAELTIFTMGAAIFGDLLLLPACLLLFWKRPEF